MPLPPIVTKEYKDTKEFERDAAKMAAQGYKVLSVRNGKTEQNIVQRYFRNPSDFYRTKRLIVIYQLG